MKHRILLFGAAALLGAAPALVTAKDGETVHVVEPGETLNGIANRAGVSAAEVAKANHLAHPYVVRVGQKLTIPGKKAEAQGASNMSGSVHEVAAGETLNGIANRAGVPATAIAKANGLKPPYALRRGQKLRVPGERSEGAPVRNAAQMDIPRTKPNSAAPELETLHVVAAGETLGGIAQRAKVPRVLIAEANGLTPPYSVRVGQKLNIPRTRHHTVETGDTGFSISYKYGVPWEQIAVANGMDPKKPVKLGQDLLIPTLLEPPAMMPAGRAPVASPAAVPTSGKARFLWPVTGPVRREFRAGSDYHDGIDITAPKGTMVRAAGAGTVKFAGNEKEQFGNLVVLDHGDGWFTAYGFLSRVTVKQGARVAAGERIGLVGSTGLAKGDELHFEVRQDGKPMDPLDELPKIP